MFWLMALFRMHLQNLQVIQLTIPLLFTKYTFCCTSTYERQYRFHWEIVKLKLEKAQIKRQAFSDFPVELDSARARNTSPYQTTKQDLIREEQTATSLHGVLTPSIATIWRVIKCAVNLFCISSTSPVQEIVLRLGFMTDNRMHILKRCTKQRPTRTSDTWW